MSNPPDRPWSEEEKYFLLTEILKRAGVSSNFLLGGYSSSARINGTKFEYLIVLIPSRPGRSMNSCRTAFNNMQAQYQPYSSTPTIPAVPTMPTMQTIAPAPASIQMPRPEVTRSSAPPVDPNLRKRPLYPADKPRAIQPRPPASVASYSSESGTSAQLSPKLEGNPGEPPRKRGRPSKAETERRKLAAEARGETYPPPRRSGSGRLKIPGPGSPAVAIASYTHAHAHPHAHANIPHLAHGPGPGSMPFDHSARPIAPAPGLQATTEERRELPNMPSRVMGPNLRELPRPPEINHPLPSPHALQLGPPDSILRFNSNPGERGVYSAIPQDRFSPDSSRRDSVASRGDPNPQGPYSEGRASTTPGEKPR
ncbi:uncharacterized protein N7483_001668 [Penicillium malachiteum]|uniref:uncharacterized protein n=1 Tax=Penicillium malachiteum TaxID=1324776 RepID=UPI002548F116|nr:uncharacterized protein N7483_001668 [Penicillium malachiteum]KAJ5736543.1 hypothetical protein N7483_001668 [Penicillium malachiteum]